MLPVTSHARRASVMTMSWHMMMDFVPPLIGCVVSSASHSVAALSVSGACVIAIPDVELARTVARIGNCSGREVDKLREPGDGESIRLKSPMP